MLFSAGTTMSCSSLGRGLAVQLAHVHERDLVLLHSRTERALAEQFVTVLLVNHALGHALSVAHFIQGFLPLDVARTKHCLAPWELHIAQSRSIALVVPYALQGALAIRRRHSGVDRGQVIARPGCCRLLWCRCGRSSRGSLFPSIGPGHWSWRGSWRFSWCWCWGWGWGWAQRRQSLVARHGWEWVVGVSLSEMGHIRPLAFYLYPILD